MKKEQLLDVVEITKSNIKNTNDSLQSFRPILETRQKQMKERTLKLFNECFPEEVRYMALKIFDKCPTWKVNDKITITWFSGAMNVIFDGMPRPLFLSYGTKYGEPQRWWFTQTYFDSHALPSFRILKEESLMCDMLEESLEEIYSNIADELVKYTNEISEQHTKWLSELSDILEPARVQKTKTITITLEVPI